MSEQLVKFQHIDNPLHELQTVNFMGDQYFTYSLFPRHFRKPDMVVSTTDKNRLLQYWKRTKEGIQLTTRRDDELYDPGMHDGKFAQETGNIEPEDLWDELGFEAAEGELRKYKVQRVDPNVLPSAKHAVLTIGVLNQMALKAPDQLPFIDAYPFEGRRYWGRNMTVSTLFQMVDDLNDRVSGYLTQGKASNYDVLPAAQFFSVGSALSTSLMRHIY